MIAKRLIGCIMVRNRIAVQSFRFEDYLPIGKPEVVAEFLNRWGVDEIILLDIDATPSCRQPDVEIVQSVAAKIFTPLTVGGGISSLEDIQSLLHAGADKVSVNTGLIKDPQLIHAAAVKFGSQCIIASIDACPSDHTKLIRTARGSDTLSVQDAARLAEEMGAGEILLNSVFNDGGQAGYDLELIAAVGGITSIPIIALGGAGHPKHIVEVMQLESVSAAAIGNILHHTEHSVTAFKSYMRNRGIPVRAATNFNYDDATFDNDGRLLKKDEKILDDLGLVHVEEDMI